MKRKMGNQTYVAYRCTEGHTTWILVSYAGGSTRCGQALEYQGCFVTKSCHAERLPIDKEEE